MATRLIAANDFLEVRVREVLQFQGGLHFDGLGRHWGAAFRLLVMADKNPAASIVVQAEMKLLVRKIITSQ